MGNLSFSSLIRRPEAGAFLGMVFVFLFFSLFGGSTFTSFAGAASWLNVAANLGIIAIPIGFLMIAGELDISIGSMVPASSMAIGILSGYWELPIAVGIILTLLFGATVGLINGLLVLRTGVPSLIVTMGTLFAVTGITLFLSIYITNTTAVSLSAPEWARAVFGSFYFNSYQVIIAWWLGLTGLYVFFLHYSPWGNWLLAMGGDKESARNAGIPTEKLTVALFVLSSTSAAFVGLCQTILFNSAQVSSGMTFIFNTIISVVIGGVLLTGGFGSVIGIFFGTLTFAMVNQGIYFTDFDRNLSSFIIGVMLLIAVLMNNTFRKMAVSYTGPKSKKRG
ncbi:ABC transporter permease [Donghicola tyrosinivorans]|uniref:Xylose transport system permease protein XylH n=1 Tax=Donghicola tyrosinivorans TaxID=1652492 RepID=A0A2T0W887_9RHOB|nr:ABC transporter permease [Donghicola tyrosinivorans]PRY82908.1 simple sugar transport system permease protein [Donghicola tyrosinivorans]